MSDAPACRCCGATTTERYGAKTGHFVRQEFSFHHCAACGFRFVEPFAGYGIYDDAYYRGAGPDPFVDYESEYRDFRRTDRVREFDDLARLAGGALPAGAAPVAWLDFGCGAGGLLKYLRDRRTLSCHGTARAVEVTGHDVGTYAERLRTHDGFRILDRDALAALPGGSFDVVSMLEVIEHIREPDAVIALVARLLRPGGRLILTTGNLDGPVARRQGIHFGYCIPEIHVSLFSPRCLEHLYRRHGLVPTTVRYRSVIHFKTLKTLRRGPRRAVARMLLRVPGVTRLIDHLYSVSAMPWAVRPQSPDAMEVLR